MSFDFNESSPYVELRGNSTALLAKNTQLILTNLVLFIEITIFYSSNNSQ